MKIIGNIGQLDSSNMPFYTQYHGVMGYLILTRDLKVIFMYTYGTEVQYDDVTKDFEIIDDTESISKVNWRG